MKERQATDCYEYLCLSVKPFFNDVESVQRLLRDFCYVIVVAGGYVESNVDIVTVASVTWSPTWSLAPSEVIVLGLLGALLQRCCIVVVVSSIAGLVVSVALRSLDPSQRDASRR